MMKVIATVHQALEVQLNTQVGILVGPTSLKMFAPRAPSKRLTASGHAATVVKHIFVASLQIQSLRIKIAPV
jgi:hypothetical protein